MLGIPRFLNEGARSPIGHEDEGGRPGFLPVGVRVFGTGGPAGGGVGGLADVCVGVVDVLGDGASVGRGAEEGFAVAVASVFKEAFGYLWVNRWIGWFLVV
jgi:hypothetical protein